MSDGFGWVSVKAYTLLYTWEEARIKCSQDGTDGVKAELASPRSSTENEWFVNKADQLGLGIFWLGVNDKINEGAWKTQHGLSQSYFNWHGGQPESIFKNDDCVGTNGKWGFNWNDYYCTSKLELLCTYVQR